MLSKYQETAIRLHRKLYWFMYEIPVCWCPTYKRISINAERCKWIYYNIGLLFVILLWASSVYILGTQLFLHRKNFEILQLLMLFLGSLCFTVCLAVGRAVHTLRYNLYIGVLNQFISLEKQLHKRKSLFILQIWVYWCIDF